MGTPFSPACQVAGCDNTGGIGRAPGAFRVSQAIANYTGRIPQAQGFGDLGLKADLENQVANATRHKEELERIIAG